MFPQILRFILILFINLGMDDVFIFGFVTIICNDKMVDFSESSERSVVNDKYVISRLTSILIHISFMTVYLIIN